MPAPDRLLVVLRQARVLLRAMPGRRGRVLNLDYGEDLIIAGDLHGHLPNFQALLRVADLSRHPGRHLILQELIHGPFRYPQGGDKSHQLVDLFAALLVQYPKQVHYLLGNHELAQAINRPILKGDDNCNALFEAGVREAYGSYAPEIYHAYLEIFAELPVLIRTPNGLLITHSLPAARQLGTFSLSRLQAEPIDPTDLAPGGVIHNLVWGRDTSAAHVAAFLQQCDAQLLVTGHLPCPDGFDIPNERQIILDCANSPASYLHVPLHRPLSHTELVGCLRTLSPTVA
ncbi:MAG: metallophosphoesterase [Gemmataceae bacterium]|nr:metallophosphoesterase [Gemmataceae bacterium]MCS7269565.1 metallophosphoesterase [Gemmataceae bacterium]MDW8242377.1 metallophosphoesterase [Thermogemmata sp.]